MIWALPAAAAALLPLIAFYQPAWLIRLVQRALPDVVFVAEGSGPVVALTLDDGPDPVVTPTVLGILRRERVPASWFVIGERARRHPGLLRRMRDEGHEVANHFWSERPTWRMGRAEFRRDLLRTEALIRQVARPRLMRPASGWVRPWAPAEARRLGYRIVLGSAYAGDPAGPPRAYMRWALTRMARPGAILVLHVGPGREATAEILPALIRGVRAKGLEFVTVGRLLARAAAGPCTTE